MDGAEELCDYLNRIIPVGTLFQDETQNGWYLVLIPWFVFENTALGRQWRFSCTTRIWCFGSDEKYLNSIPNGVMTFSMRPQVIQKNLHRWKIIASDVEGAKEQ